MTEQQIIDPVLLLPHNHGEAEHLQMTKTILDNADRFRIISDIFRTMSDTTRMRIFWLLCHYEECVLNIAALMNMSSPAVSHHLRTLKENGLIESHRKGKEVYYRACDTILCQLLHQMTEQVMEVSCPEMEALPKHLDHTHTCGSSICFHDPDLVSASDPFAEHTNCISDRESQEDHAAQADHQEDQETVIRQIHELLTVHMEKRWTVEELARMFLLNPTTLKELFRSAYGNSIAAHIREHRMERAAELLRSTDRSLGEIATEVGYASQSKFTAAFKAYYHMLPRDYRKARG